MIRDYFKKDRGLTITMCVVVPLFTVIDLLGSYGPDLMANGLCFHLLGCNTGFLGYDAFVHFCSGIAETVFLLWAMRRFAKINMLHESFWKNLLIIVSLVLMLAFVWEVAELIGDQYRMLVLHKDLLHPNTLYQPSNVDTMGDLIVAVAGALLASPLYAFTRTKR